MIKSRFFLVLTILPFFMYSALTSDPDTSKYSIAPQPAWVKPCSVPVSSTSQEKLSCGNVRHLLVDSQRNWEEKILYIHQVSQPLTKKGVELISQIKVQFAPSYERLCLHEIKVLRNGEWIDKTKSSRYELLQREQGLSDQLYYGSLTLVCFLDDIREGDILDYSFSREGCHPMFTEFLTDSVYFRHRSSPDLVIHRLLAHPDQDLYLQPHNIDITPTVLDLTPQLREWTWKIKNTEPITFESNTPYWFNPDEYIHMNQYGTWQNVVNTRAASYVLAPDFAELASMEMQSLINEWQTLTDAPEEQSLLALRFVQDEIRYFGFEDGEGSHKPRDPNITLEKRYGDCKDKVMLLHALLKLMDIASTPALVHTTLGTQLSKSFPSSTFNHVVLQVTIDDTIYWVDTTISLQGGTLQTTFFPTLGWGLLVNEDTTSLTALPETAIPEPTIIDTSVRISSDESGELTTQVTLYGADADRFRRTLAKDGHETFLKRQKIHYQEIYGAAQSTTPLYVQDDRAENILTFTEVFTIPHILEAEQSALSISSQAIRRSLQSKFSPDRTSPYALKFPLWTKETIRIESPYFPLETKEDSHAYKHESLSYNYSIQSNGTSIELSFELRVLKDHVPASDIWEFWKIAKAINKKAVSEIPIR